MRVPSPALVISVIALFVALGGTGYAAVKINGKQIKKGTVQGTALRKNTLTGTQINEAKLAKVPSAAAADNAGNATTLGGLAPSAFTQGSGKIVSANRTLSTNSAAEILVIPGFAAVEATCDTSNELALRVESRGPNTRIMLTSFRPSTTVTTSGGSFNDDEGIAYGPTTSQRFTGTVWKPASASASATLEVAAISCNVTAVGLAHD